MTRPITVLAAERRATLSSFLTAHVSGCADIESVGGMGRLGSRTPVSGGGLGGCQGSTSHPPWVHIHS